MSNRKHKNPQRVAGSSAVAASRSRLRIWLVATGLAAAVLAVYAQVHGFEFVSYDDDTFVSENAHVVGGLTWDNFVWSLGIHGPGHWHPLSWWVHQLVCELFGLDAGAHHLVSVLLHVAAALALLTAFWRLTDDFWPSVLVAALFALHPISVESAAWVSHLRDPLCTFFWALVMIAYAAYARRGGPWRYGLVLLFFALGLMAKPMLMTLPCVLLLLDYWPLGRMNLGTWSAEPRELIGFSPSPLDKRSVGWLLLEKAPLFALTGVSIWLSYLCQQALGAIVSLESQPMAARLSNAVLSYVLYLRNMLWPVNLSPIYPMPRTFYGPQVAGAVVLLIALTITAIYFARRRGYLVVGWLWFLGTLVPVIGVLKMGGFKSMTDHHAYVPLLGIYMALAWALAHLFEQRSSLRSAGIGVVALVLLGLLPVSWRQVGVWRDNVSLYEHALAVTSDNSLAHTNLGVALHRQGKVEDAVGHYYQALGIDPDHAEAHSNLGVALYGRGKIEEAVKHFQHALRVKPDYAKAHSNLGDALRKQGKLAQAVEHFQRAVKLKPDFARAHNFLGDALARQGKLTAAIQHYHRALQIEPEYVDAHLNLGLAIHMQGDIPAAALRYAHALDLDPDLPLALNNLARVRASCPEDALRDGAQAVELAKRSCHLTAHQAATPLDTLAAAYAEAGQFDMAITTAAQAIDLATAAGDTKLAGEVRARVLLYQQGLPYREPSK
ncbi:MAG: tetratricopeptide repeat protein [Pirellulales bacterium]|nr:tetratricopeptide repeat protein [Pirellulales bacterium]